MIFIVNHFQPTAGYTTAQNKMMWWRRELVIFFFSIILTLRLPTQPIAYTPKTCSTSLNFLFCFSHLLKKIWILFFTIFLIYFFLLFKSDDDLRWVDPRQVLACTCLRDVPYTLCLHPINTLAVFTTIQDRVKDTHLKIPSYYICTGWFGTGSCVTALVTE